MNGRITATVLCSILVAVVIFYISITWYQDTFNSTIIWTQSISEKDSTEQNKIFIIGNSHVGSIDPEYIQEFLNQEGHNFTVYNLSTGGDNPQKRTITIEPISELEPNFVIYGIDFRSFEAGSSEQDIQAVSTSKVGEIERILPSLQDFFKELTFPLSNNELSSKIPESPKLVTLRMVNHIIHGSVELERLDLDSKKPLITNEAVGLEPMSEIELQEWIDERRTFRGIPQPEQNFQLKSLEKILDKLEKNKIQFILFTTPHHQTYLDYLSTSDKETFEEILIQLEKKYDISIYRLDEKYKNEEIFSNPTHVATETSQEYSQDILEMIKSELGS